MKRVISFLLVIAMLLGNIPATVFAADNEPVVTEISAEETSAPVESPTDPPVETTAPTVVETEPPVTETEPPVSEPEAPTQPSVPVETVTPTEETEPAEEPTAPVPSDPAPIAESDEENTDNTASINWVIENGVLIISGSGAMTDCTSKSGAPWYTQREEILAIRVGEDITGIGNYAFYDCRNAVTVELPSTLERIGSYAFQKCAKLEEISLPDTVTGLGIACFSECTALSRVKLSAGWIECLSLGSSTGLNYQGEIFYGCSALKEITVPDGVTKLPDYAFNKCTYLEKIHLPESLTEIGTAAFYGCTKLQTVTGAENLTTLGSSAFYNCKVLQSITLAEGTADLPDQAFYNCSALKTIELPATLTSVGKDAFSGCSSLENLELPDSVESIGYHAFAYCSKLSSITLPAGWKECPSYHATSFGLNYQGNLFYNCSSLTTVVIPDGLECIPSYALAEAKYLQTVTLPSTLTRLNESEFSGCQNLKSITVPENVTALPDYVFKSCSGMTEVNLPQNLKSIGREAFYGCSSLESLELPDSVESIGYRAFASCTKLSSITLPAGWKECPSYHATSSGSSYQGNLFYNCSSLTTVVIPDGLACIPSYALVEAKYLQTVTLPASLTRLSDSEFSGCQNLQSITVPENVTALPDYVFKNCSGLTEVNLPQNLKSIGREAFYGCSSLESLELPASVESIGYRAFASCTKLSRISLPAGWKECPSYHATASGSSYQGNLFYNCSSLTAVSIPKGLTAIPSYALFGAKYVQTVTLPSSLTVLNESEFSGCQNLKSITIPENVTALPDYVFKGCSGMTEVNLPRYLESVGREAFYGCSALEMLTIPNTVESIGYRAFASCSKLSSITLPANWKECPSYSTSSFGSSYQGCLFYNCSSLTQVTLPEGMERIPEYAFAEAAYLQDIFLPTTLTEISVSAFYNCKALQQIVIPEGIKEIPDRVFYNCDGLTYITLPSTLQSIGREAFYGCDGLEALSIPDSVVSLGHKAFANCVNLERIYLPAGWRECPSYNENTSGSNYQGNLFNGCKSLLHITVPEGITAIPDYAFSQNAYLQTISLPSTLRTLPGGTFYDCTALESITIPEGVTVLPEYAFDGCSALTQVQLPASLRQIDRFAFSNCDSLQTLVIPDGVTSLGYRAFSDCDRLTSVTLPASWRECHNHNQDLIGPTFQGQLFHGCKALTELRIPDGVPQLPAYAFYDSDSLQTVHFPDSIVSLGISAFYDCNGLLSVTLPDSLAAIDESAFQKCTSLKNVIMGDGIKTIGQNAFARCTSLETIHFSQTLEEIGSYAFRTCTALTSIELPDSLQKIGSFAFSECSALQDIDLNDTAEIGNSAFKGLVTEGTLNNLSWSFDAASRVLTVKGTGDMVLPRNEKGEVVPPWAHLNSLTRTLVLEQGILTVDEGAFRGFNNIHMLDTGNTIQVLGTNCFADCTKLTRAIVGEGMKQIGTGAFSGCTALKQFVIITETQDLAILSNAIPNTNTLTVIYPETESYYQSYFRNHYSNVRLDTWDNTLPGRDVVLVLDISGSMTGERIESLKTAAKMFLDRVDGITTNSRIAIISYNSNAYQLSDFTWNTDYLKSQVDTLNADGGTEYYNALKCAEAFLERSDEDVRAMIFFTDGEPNDPTPTILDKCEQLRKQYRIYTVGFQPSSVGQDLLIQMAGGGKNYYTSSDMETLAEAFKALSGDVGNELVEEEYYTLTQQRQFSIRPANGRFPIDIGFQVTVGDQVFTSGLEEDALVSEEIIEVIIPEGYSGNVTISREGYVTCTIPIKLVDNHTSVLMYPITGSEPFPQQLKYQPAPDKQYYNDCFERVSIAQAALSDDGSVKQRFYADIQWMDHKPGDVWLEQAGTVLYLKDKEFCDVAFSKTFKAGAGDVYLHFRSADGYAGSIKTGIYVCPADNRIKLELGSGVTIPGEDVSKLKLLGDRDLTIDMSNLTTLPISVEMKADGTVSGTIGLKNDSGVSGGGEGDTIREAFSAFEKGGTMSENLEDMLDELTSMCEPMGSSWGISGSAWFVGYYSGRIDANGDVEFKELSVMLIVKGSATYTIYPWPVPVYFQAGLELAVQSKIALEQKNNALVPSIGTYVEPKLTVTIGAGIGAEGVLSGGVQGDGSAGLNVPLIVPEDLEAYVEGQFSFVGTLLGVTGKKEIFGTNGKYYFYKNREFTWEHESNLAELSTFELIEEPVHNSVFYSRGLKKTVNDIPYQILKSDTTQYSAPKLITYDDGTQLVVWLDAVPGRTGADVHGVYYSYNNGSTWTAPALIHDDGTNDYGLSLTIVDGYAYVLWHDYDTSFRSDLNDLEVAASHINVSAAKFDHKALSMQHLNDFSGGGYDYLPQLRKQNSQLQVAWTNSTQDGESVYLSVSQDGVSWSEPSRQDVTWYEPADFSLPGDGSNLQNMGAAERVQEGNLSATVFRRADSSGTQNVFAIFNDGSGWGEPVQLTWFKDGDYVDAFGAEIHDSNMQLILNVTHSNGKSDLAYMQVPLGTDLAVVRADYDHFTLVPGKNAVFFARVTNRGIHTEDMLKLRLVDAEGNVLKTQLTNVSIPSGSTKRLEMNYLVPADNSLQQVSLVVLPVHSQDLNEENNSMTVDIQYKDISVEEMSAWTSDDATTVTARIVNRGNEPLPQIRYTLHYDTPEGRQVAQGMTPQIAAGEVATLNLTLEPLEAEMLLYLKLEELEDENLFTNNMGVANIKGVYGDAVTITSVSVDRDYLALESGETVQLNADCTPNAAQSNLQWRVETVSGYHVITVTEGGLVTAHNPGTAYAIAYVSTDEGEVAARCRIDVTAMPNISGVQLSTTTLSTELYSTNYTGFEILLQLPQNYDNTISTYALRGGSGIAIESACFTDETMANFFELAVLDDRSVLLIPTETAVQNPKAVASKYTGTITVSVMGNTFETETLTLSVKKTIPKITATVAAFNSFYSGQSQKIVIKGGTPTKICVNASQAAALPGWLRLEADVLKLTEDAPLKSASGNANLLVYTEEWRIPAAVKLSVKSTYKTPSLKLSASGVTVSPENSAGVSLKLLSSDRNKTLKDLNIASVTAQKGYSIENFNPADGSFLLKANGNFVPGTVQLNVTFTDTDGILPLTVKVKTGKIALKLENARITLNSKVSDCAEIALTATPADYRLDAIRINAPSELTARYDKGKIYIATNAATPASGTYKISITSDSAATELTVKVISNTPSVTFKATGNVDLTFPGQSATITSSFKNYSGKIASYTYSVVDAKTGESVSDAFAVDRIGDTSSFGVRCTNAEKVNTTSGYNVALKLSLTDGTEVSGSTKLKVKRTNVSVKLGSTKLSLNKKLGESGEVALTCTTKGYSLENPIIQVMDSTGKNSAADKLTVTYRDGILTVKQTKQTKYGDTYKVLVKANSYSSAATLQVAIPKEEKSAVTATLKVSGKIDVIRGNTSITVTPTYKNCTAQADRQERLTILNGKNEDVTDLFLISRNGNGSFTIRRDPQAKLDHSQKYRAKLTAVFNGTKVESKETSLSVTMGSAKLTVAASDTTLFAKDKNDRLVFCFNAADDALNGVSKVTVKENHLFEIVPYGDGVYALTYKDGSVHSSLVKKDVTTVTVTLNVTLDGNETAKTNAAVKLKVTVIK